MRTLSIVLISAFISLLPSCQPSGKPTGDFNLLPQPRVAEFTGTSAMFPDSLIHYRLADGIKLPVPPAYLKELQETSKLSGSQIVFRRYHSLEIDAEGYTLDITRDRVTISGNKKAGLLYGYMTLQQLMNDAREQGIPLPLCHIEDSPQLSYRAIHLDMKHHMEKKEYYYELIDQLARYKVNGVIAEVEDKLGYERQPLVGSEDALSIKEWKKLSKYAKARNIEISPLVQGLGHASFILKHDQYKNLRDDPESDWAFNPLDPETYELQFDLYLDAMEAMPRGDYLHVGGDEVHTTGRGSEKTELELQLTWLNKVCEFAEEHDRTPIFWDDMPLKYAGLYSPMFNTRHSREEVDSMWRENEHKLLESLDLFPKKCIYMRWNYSSPQAEGNIKAMEWFSEQGLPVMGATAGQTRWVLMPQNESNMENIRSFTVTSIEKGLDGLLLTLWDDDSPHFELYMRGILAFAEYAWSGDQRSKEEIKAAYRHREYANALSGEEYGFVDQLEHAVGWWNASLLQSRSRNSLRTMEDPAGEGVIELPFSGEKGEWTKKHSNRLEAAAAVMRDCDEIASTIETMKSQAKRNHYRLEVYEQVNQLVRFSAQTMFVLQAYDIAQAGQEEQEALAIIKQLSQEFASLRAELEKVYGRTRVLTKPEGYMLDQDHHRHLANQTRSFDWLYTAELFFLDKVDNQIKAN
ncbi:MAG: beta-N-acetylhexosaminidase [Bacteroidales bacterium]|nr:beta-N-acetylhexosaminidase [Bacteroidales bacterium]